MRLTARPSSSSLAVESYYMYITGLRHFRDVNRTVNNSLNSFSHAQWSHSLPRFRRAQHRYVAATYKQCIDKQKHDIRVLKATPDFRHIGRCMRSFDMFCDINASSAAQALSTPGSQLMKTTRFISTTVWCTLLCLTSYAGILWAWQLDAMRRDDSWSQYQLLSAPQPNAQDKPLKILFTNI